jgi:molecular chaperone GrpE (heat shock protein)
MDIIFTIDDIAKLVNNYKSKEQAELNPLKLLKQMEMTGADLEDILIRQGVESYSYSQPKFEPRRQKVVKTEVTHDRSKDKTVSRQVQKGYEWEGNVLRQERVNVYVYQPVLENPGIDENKKEEEES